MSYLDPSKVMSGRFGKLYHDGEWLTNVQSASAQGEVSKEEILRAGTRSVGHKVMSITWSGSMSGYKVTSKLAKLIAQVKDNTKGGFVTELVFKLDDPEALSERVWVRLKGVQFDTIPILNYEVGSMVTEEVNFTFSDFEYL